MSDSLERDQLNLWQQLNRLYGGGAPQIHPVQRISREEPDGIIESGPDKRTGIPLPDGGTGEPVAEDCDSLAVLSSAGLEKVGMVEHPVDDTATVEPIAVNEACAACCYDCHQTTGQFLIARCRLAAQSKPHHKEQTPNRVAASQGAMGIEKINETCRRCSRSCKQRTTKLNRMLCLGLSPLDQ